MLLDSCIETNCIFSARAKFLRAKKMATSNSGDKSHLNEILGIKSSSSTTTTTNNNQGYQTFETSSSTFMAAFTV
jgi:Pin2-interacting protein X1